MAFVPGLVVIRSALEAEVHVDAALDHATLQLSLADAALEASRVVLVLLVSGNRLAQLDERKALTAQTCATQA